MKANIHPVWHKEAKVTCACGNTFITGSTLPSISVDICSKCHPLFTGQQKFVDTLGQVDRFQQKTQKAKTQAELKAQIQKSRLEKVQTQKSEKPTLKDLLMQARKNLHS